MLEVNNIHKTYHNVGKAIPVLQGVDLKIERGEFIAIVGPSGAGKSTLLNILGGLDMPTSGKVLFEGEDIYKLDDAVLCRLRNKRIGFVFQFYHLLSEFTVLENVLMPAFIGLGGRRDKTDLAVRALGFLNRMGLNKRIAHLPMQLSGGERQRVAIVRALINSPDLLLCDEPTGNLDSGSGGQIISLIRKINTENKMTVVLVTHNLELAKTTDRVYYLKDGVLEG
ncbi:MAG: ABC transporter ATP-binding protein [bacterium]